MGRNEPLISLPVLLIVIFSIVAVLVVVSTARVRRRVPWVMPEAFALAALLLLHLLFFWQPYRTPAQVPAGGGDLVSFFYPIHAFAARTIANGDFPFWSPNQYAGMPHLANFQTGALYPPNLIAYILSPEFPYATLERLVLFHFLLASVGTYWLARALGRGRLPAVLAAGIFSSSGFMVAHLGHYSMLSTAAWMPLVFAAIVAAVRRRSWPIALGGTLALACCVLGGHQPILLMVLTGALALGIFELWRATGYATDRDLRAWLNDRVLRGGLLRLGFMAVIGAGITLPVLGPAFELTRYTTRAGLSYEQASEFSIEPIALIHLILPTVFGSNPTNYWGPFSNTEIWGYAGVVSLLLAGLGLAAGRVRARWFWGAVALLSILYAVGPFSPLHGWAFGFLPGYDRIRGAGRAMMFFDLAIALLAALGLERLIERRPAWTPALSTAMRRGLLALGILLVGLIIVVIPLFMVQVLGTDNPSNRPMITLDNLILLVLWLGLAALLGLLAVRGKLQGAALGVLVLILVLLDIFSATASFNPTTAPILSGFEHPRVVSTLRAAERERPPFRIESLAAAWQPDSARLYGFADIGGLFDPLALEDYQHYLAEATSDRTSEVYRSLNVRFILTDPDAPPPVPGATERLRTDEITLWELSNPGPRAWLGAAPDLTLEYQFDQPNQLTITIPEGAPGGRLIISQAWYPGWSARVDRQAVDVESFEQVLQVVEVPAGAHTVVLMFEPTGWALWLIGGAISGLIWLVAAGAIVWMWLRGVGRRAP